MEWWNHLWRSTPAAAEIINSAIINKIKMLSMMQWFQLDGKCLWNMEQKTMIILSIDDITSDFKRPLVAEIDILPLSAIEKCV